MLMRRERARMSGAASAVLGGTFLIAAMAHATDGFTESVASAAPSVVLGILSGVALLVAAFGLLSQRYWGWKVGIGAHLLAIGSLLIALFSVAAGYGDRAASLAIPGGLLVLLSLSLLALWRARPRNPARRIKHEIAARMY
jgi:ABC-type antimicrobial peptide transport system permease subunit